MGVLNALQLLLPTWTAAPEVKRPLELFEPARKAMVMYFSGQASKLAVIKAMQKEGGTVAALMCKLCIYVRIYYLYPQTKFLYLVNTRLLSGLFSDGWGGDSTDDLPRHPS